MQTRYSYQLKFRLSDVILAPLKVSIYELQGQVISLPLQAIVRRDLAEPIKQDDPHLCS